MTIFLFISGLAILIIGAEALVRGASRIASGIGISPLVIGLTVVAFGTSSPELAVSIHGAVSGQSAVTLGNVVGSNIFNILFILGLTALIRPLTVSQQLIRFDVPLMVMLSFATLILTLDLRISRFEGLLLVTALIVYTTLLIYWGMRPNREPERRFRDKQDRFFLPEVRRTQEPERRGHAERSFYKHAEGQIHTHAERSFYKHAEGQFHTNAEGQIHTHAERQFHSPGWYLLHVILMAGGLALLVLGSRWLVDGAVMFAEQLGISEVIIGLTIVAAGTSLPEVVTSVIAVIRGNRDLAVGNIVGSNIFNILGVLGLAGILSPAGIAVSDTIIGFDIPLMIAVAIACLPVFFTGGTISRWEGALFLGYYVAYTFYLVLAAIQHETLLLFTTVMLCFVIPLTVVTIIVVVVQEFRRKRRSEAS